MNIKLFTLAIVVIIAQGCSRTVAISHTATTYKEEEIGKVVWFVTLYHNIIIRPISPSDNIEIK